MAWFRRKAHVRPPTPPAEDGVGVGPHARDAAPRRGEDASATGSAPPPGPAADAVWSGWAQQDADVVWGLLRRAFAEHGLDVSLDGTTVVDAGGRPYDLDTLLRACRGDGRGRRGWPETVRGEVTRLVEAVDASPFDGRDAASLLASTYSRVVATDATTSGGLGYARTVAPGLIEVLNLDLPESVAFFGDDAVQQHGPVEDLWRAGRVNLRGVEPERRQTLEREGGRVQVLFSDSMFLASTVLHLDELVARETGTEPDPDLGVLVAMPHRHQLAFHVVGDDTLLPSLALLAKFAAVGHTDSPGPVSPDVYWWHHGRLDRLTTLEGERIQVDADVEFTRVVEQVTGERGD